MRLQTTWRLGHLALVGLLLSVPLSGTTSAQALPVAAIDGFERIDARWVPWIGCWQLIEEIGSADEWRAPARDADQAGLDRPQPGVRPAGRVFACLLPGEVETAVDVTTVARGSVFVEKTVRADGARHPIGEAACRGWQLNQWSLDGLRLFTHAELACENDAYRLVSGVSVLTDPATWLDIQLVDMGGDVQLAVRRYQRVSDQQTTQAGLPLLPEDVASRVASAARLVIGDRLSVSDVVDAAGQAEPEVVEALLVETAASFDLDGQALIDLDDAGVDGSVIDLMVALSFPEQFAVRRASASNLSGRGSNRLFGGYGDSRYYDLYPYYASPFGHYYHYGYAPYPWAYWGPGSTYLLTRGDSGVGSSGAVIQSRGFAQVRSLTTSSGTGRRAKQRGSSASSGRSGGGSTGGSSAGRSGGSSGGGRSGGGRVTSGGYRRPPGD